MKKIIAACLFIFLFSPSSFSQNGPLVIKDSEGYSAVDWNVLKKILYSFPDLSPLATKDSVDYIGQVYYLTPNNAQGFERTALKRIKKNGKWYYEAFFKIKDDTVKVKREFGSLYRAFEKTFKENTGNDFIFAAVAKDSLRRKDMNWLAQWTLYDDYKLLPPGLKKVRVGLLLNGMQNFMDKTKMDYIIKLYISDDKIDYDFFSWDTPK